MVMINAFIHTAYPSRPIKRKTMKIYKDCQEFAEFLLKDEPQLSLCLFLFLFSLSLIHCLCV